VITQKTIEDFYERTRQLKANGRTRIDIDGECRWSYFFVDSNSEKLLALGEELAREGYEPRGLLYPDPNDDDQKTIVLRVDRIETHSVGSLVERTNQFYALARDARVQGYDGMDVGLVSGP
jgi:hypothetical protein